MKIELYGHKYSFQKGTDAAYVVGELSSIVDRLQSELIKAQCENEAQEELLDRAKELLYPSKQNGDGWTSPKIADWVGDYWKFNKKRE